MEEVKKIDEFISSGDGDGSGSGSGYGSGYGSGSGSGYGSGYGYGDGYGSGYGSGYGDGDGYGSGYGDGDGSGSGSGIKSINGQCIYHIDDVQTVIDRIRGNVAKGKIVNSDLTLTPCYVAKNGGTFAHGETLHEAMDALRDKLFEDMSDDERISAFMERHELDRTYPNTDLFDWHNKLTGSCLAGRKAWISDHGLSLEGETTVREFIELTKNAYGGEVIRRMEERYKEVTNA